MAKKESLESQMSVLFAAVAFVVAVVAVVVI